MRLPYLPLLLPLLVACAPEPNMPVTGSDLAMAASIPVSEGSLPAGTKAQFLGKVEGRYCVWSSFAEEARKSDAIDRMKVNALRMGATSVYDTACTVTNKPGCSSLSLCTGYAFKE